MRRLLLRTKAILRDALKPVTGAILGALAVGLLRGTRYFDPDRTANFFASVTRAVGPWLPEHKIGRANLTAAFPEKSPPEIDTILMGVWENLGRVGAEFAHIDHLWDLDPESWESGRIEPAPGSIEKFLALRDDGKYGYGESEADSIYATFVAEYDLSDSWTVKFSEAFGRNRSALNPIDGFCSSCALLALNGTAQLSGSTTTTDVAGQNVIALNLPLTTANALDVWRTGSA
ncbi:hypothetical protein, partial [Xanthomonas oryzae]|uniref:hypothetical protein n=1 Tax=Xanthomonas oryzae TaxID=347 RepID=UPI000AFB3B46